MSLPKIFRRFLIVLRIQLNRFLEAGRSLFCLSDPQQRHPEICLLRSQEIDILADGSLDQDDDILEELDLVVISVHSRFDLSAADQTRRITDSISGDGRITIRRTLEKSPPRSTLIREPHSRIIGSGSADGSSSWGAIA